jgi:O-antigen ligase
VTQAIRNHPFFGSGVGSTVSIGLAGPQDIHMTYLQIWANQGIWGILSYMWLTLGWLLWIPDVVRRIRQVGDDRARALYYNAVVRLFVFCIGACTFPFAYEWSDWIPFIVPYALLWYLLQSGPRNLEDLSPSLA